MCATVLMTGDQTYTISELAREFGITPRAIRYYEDQGLLAPERAGQTRIYCKRDRARLRLTLRGKRLGFSLAEIGEMLDLYDATHDERRQLVHCLHALSKRKARLEQQREDIDAVLAEITAFEHQCRDLIVKPVQGETHEASKQRSAA